MNQLNWQLKRYILLSILICLQLLAKIGSGPGLLRESLKRLLTLALVNIKLILLLFVIILSWQLFLSINSFLNSLPKFDFNILNSLSAPAAISIYDQNNNLLAKTNRDYFYIPINLSQMSSAVIKEQQDYSSYSQKLADRLFTEPLSVKITIKRNILANRINRMFSKEQVLTAYLNTLTFPDYIIGIEAAAEYFLGKNASKLSLKDYQYLIGLSLNNETPKLKYPIYRRAPDAIDYVKTELKSRYPDIWQNNQEINVLTSIDLKLQNDLQQFVLTNLPSPDLSNLAIIDPDSRFLLALVGHPIGFNKPESFHSIKRITDLKQNILLQNDQGIPSHPPIIVSLNPDLNDKKLLSKFKLN